MRSAGRKADRRTASARSPRDFLSNAKYKRPLESRWMKTSFHHGPYARGIRQGRHRTGSGPNRGAHPHHGAPRCQDERVVGK